jgi:uncharacterized protein (DUF2225 family)
MKDIPTEQDFTDSRNYELILLMPDNFNFHLSKSIDTRIQQFIIAYIMYRWLETKLPEQALTYLARSEKIISNIKTMLTGGIRSIRRRNGYW